MASKLFADLSIDYNWMVCGMRDVIIIQMIFLTS